MTSLLFQGLPAILVASFSLTVENKPTMAQRLAYILSHIHRDTKGQMCIIKTKIGDRMRLDFYSVMYRMCSRVFLFISGVSRFSNLAIVHVLIL